jgi:hypothetical protein
MKDSTSENGVYRTIDYTNESDSDADNHNNGVWIYLLHNDNCYATLFFPEDDAVDTAMSNYLDMTASKVSENVWSDESVHGKITIVRENGDDQDGADYMFFIEEKNRY